MIRIVIWATHLQTDILAVTAHLDGCRDVALLIVAADAAAFLGEPVARALDLRAPVLNRAAPDTMEQVRAFHADVAVADNHVPPKGVAPRLFYMWHGLGWKARSKLDLQVFYRQVKRLTGVDPRRPSAVFRAQCYGPTDRAWRIADWRLPPESCVEVGMAAAALVRDPPYDADTVAAQYRIDVARRKTVLLSVTWHSGTIAADNDAVGFVRSLLRVTSARNANLLICLHERRRYDLAFIAAIEALVAAEPHCEIRFKDEHPDNLSDLLAADVMISNLSSFLAYFYLLGRPAIHVLPQLQARIDRVVMLLSRWRIRRTVRAEQAWMIDPQDTGGPRVADAEAAALAVADALGDPAPGGIAAQAWLERHVPLLDERAPARIKEALSVMCGGQGPMLAAVQ